MGRTSAYILLAAFFFYSCTDKQEEKPLFSLLDNTGITFSNTVQDTKELNIINYRNFYNGGGVAIGDINNDGLSDVFFTANQASNKLYLNKGNWQFEDISVKAGFTDKKQWSTGVVMVDINADGWLDIFVCNAGHMEDSSLRRNQLFINNHNLTFTECAAKYGLDDIGYTTQASFFDYDIDGDLDCFIINNSPISPVSLNYINKRGLPDAEWPILPEMKGGGDHLYRNDNGRYVDVSKQAGIYGSTMSFGLGATVGDVNHDGYPDVYVSNDFYEQDYLYINQKDGTFKDEMEQWMQHTSLASMGADLGDINNDGYPDIFTTDMLPGDDYRVKTTFAFEDINVYRLKQRNGIYHQFFQNTLQLNNKNGKFADVANYAGVSATDWSWGGLMFDADNDGNTDLYVCNGIYHDLINQDFLDFSASEIMQRMIATGEKEDMNVIIDKMPSIHVLNKMYRNHGDLRFEDTGEKWGFSQPSFSNGAAYGDLDNDGDLDLIVNNVNQPAFVYRNNAAEYNGNKYIAVSLKGSGNNTFAIGSIIKVFAGKQILTREVIPSRGFQSSMDYRTIIGLGSIKQADSMIIQWPDRSYSRYINPVSDKVYLLKETEEIKYPPTPVLNMPGATMFENVASDFEKHTEDDYVDFFYERNIPRMLSREGPKAAVADVNGDGLDDVFIGGTNGHPGQLYIQEANGRFSKKVEKAVELFPDFEDVAVLFFDCDNDKDQDLVIGPGGNNVPAGSRQLQLRLYKNDGKGNFELDTKAFPVNNANISVITSNDFDADGDRDLFIGARNIPRQYGLTPLSFLFVNDGSGHFTDIAKEKGGGIAEAGMVTGAVWADVADDKQDELIIVAEWETPKVFSFKKDHFEEVKTNLAGMYGWWQTVEAIDVNGDGRKDIVLGNIGENCYLRPDESRPVKIWINDFDNNGVVDKIITYTVEGKDKPVFLKRDLEESMPFLKKQNLRHEVYATKSVQELVSPDKIKEAIVKTFNYSASCVAYNNSNGRFTIRKLPPMVQLSSVNAVRSVDINNDNIPDLVLGGNLFNFQPQLERLDASHGDVLINDRKENLRWIEPSQTGLALRGELRDIAVINGRRKQYLLFLQNDMVPLLYTVRNIPVTDQK